MRSEDIARLLPDVFQYALEPGSAAPESDRRLAAVLAAMETLHDPCERALDDLATSIDPRLTAPRFVPYLAGWVDLDWLLVPDPAEPRATGALLTSGLGQLRELVAAATWLARWRGTAQGLRRFLDAATGIPGFAIEQNVSGSTGEPRPFHIRVIGPPAAEPLRPLVERIVRAEKPANVTWELAFTAAVAPRDRSRSREGLS